MVNHPIKIHPMLLTKTHSKQAIIRTVYLYLFSVVGLVLLTIGSVRLVDMALKAFIFTQAEQEQRLNFPFREPPIQLMESRFKPIIENKPAEFTPDEISALKAWIAEYQQWQEKQGKIDYVTVRRHQTAAESLGMILIGLPLYLYHWLTIKKETPEK